MPDPSGAGTTTDDQGQAGASGAQSGGDASNGGAGAAGTQQQGQGAQDQRLSAEAAKWRTQYRESQKKIEQLTSEIEALKTQNTASPGGDQSASEVAGLKRQMSDLQKSLKEQQDRAAKAEEMSKQEKLDNALLKAVSDAKLVDPDEATLLLKAKGRARIADDGKPVFVISDNGEEREVVITAEAIRQHKLVSEKFFPAEGVAGSGSRGGARGAGASGVDMNRALTDLAYFEANKEKILAERRRSA